ncbi:LamG domain-containing protein, partial [Candidatus Poribacteria bacterium]|nr:LamG domain-containing protein [Candidatus Poribacteria bacterium]
EDGLIAYWDFDENSGNTASDRTGNGHDGELVGKPEWVEGPFGSALRFDDAGEYVLVPHDDALNFTDAVTVAAFFNPDGDLTSRRLLVKNDSFFVIFDFGVTTSIDFLVKPNNDFAESSTADWTVGTWYHFAGTFDGDTLRVYVDGVLEGESETGTPIAPSTLDLWIGADDFGRATDAFPGVIDEVRLYDRALDEGEIGDIMEGPQAVEPRGKAPVAWAKMKTTYARAR